MKSLELSRAPLVSGLVVAVLSLSACSFGEKTPEQQAATAAKKEAKAEARETERKQKVQSFIEDLSSAVSLSVSDMSLTAVYRCRDHSKGFHDCSNLEQEQVSALYAYIESMALRSGSKKCDYSSIDYSGTTKSIVANCPIDEPM